MHTHIELRGREMMKTKKILQAVYFFMCMKVHWWNFQRNPTPNNDITEKKRWCQSPSAAACHQQKPTKATQLQPTKPANWKHIHPTEKTLKKSVDFFSLKITESTNHPNKKSVNFFVSWKSLKAQSNHPTEKTVNFFVSLNSLKAQSITQLKKLWTLFCFAAFGLQRLEHKFPLWVCSSSFKVFI